MKLLHVCLIVTVHTLVITAKRRRVLFNNYPSMKTTNDVMATKPARSRIECSVICLNDPYCLSASYCKISDGYTCQLSGHYSNGSFSEFVAVDGCSQTVMVNPCENAGTFYPGNRSCHCVEGFVGDYCQRRFRDCTEAPYDNIYDLIQPFGTDYIFEWKCYGYLTYAADFHSFFYPTQQRTWQDMRDGIPIRKSGQVQFYFLGLETLHQLTKQGVYDMFVRLYTANLKKRGFVWYRNVRVDSAAEGYPLHWDKVEQDNMFRSTIDYLLDGFGAVGDATMSINGARFATFDNDINGCARANNASWWYNPLNCTVLMFDADGLYWPTNRTGRMELQQFEYVSVGLMPRYWYTEDDLFL